jgi:phage-related protein
MAERLPKHVDWAGTSREDVRCFPRDARQAVGRELQRVQWGALARDCKPMTTIGSGVWELRVHTRTEHRLVYIAKFEEAIYVLHAFEKRSRKTAQRDIHISRRRLAEVIRQRQGPQP